MSEPSIPDEAHRPIDVYIAGCGIVPMRDITLETLAILKRSTSYSIFGNPNIKPFLEHYNLTYVDLSAMYRWGEFRSIGYYAVAERIVDVAVQSPPVTYLTYGHPTLLDDIAREILRRSKARGLLCAVVPGVSFIDWLVAKRPISIGRAGLRLVVAAELISQGMTLDAKVPTFIAQIAARAGRQPADTERSQIDDCAALTDHLLQYYPPTHVVTVCDLDASGCEPIFIDLPLLAWTLTAPGLTYATTLYVPPLTD